MPRGLIDGFEECLIHWHLFLSPRSEGIRVESWSNYSGEYDLCLKKKAE